MLKTTLCFNFQVHLLFVYRILLLCFEFQVVRGACRLNERWCCFLYLGLWRTVRCHILIGLFNFTFTQLLFIASTSLFSINQPNLPFHQVNLSLLPKHYHKTSYLCCISLQVNHILTSILSILLNLWCKNWLERIHFLWFGLAKGLMVEVAATRFDGFMHCFVRKFHLEVVRYKIQTRRLIKRLTGHTVPISYHLNLQNLYSLDTISMMACLPNA